MVFSAFVAEGGSGGKPPRRNRGWIWFFVILGCLSVVAIVVQVWFNAQQQLTPEHLAEARKRWNEKGPRDYDLEYQFKKIDSTDHYLVEVRGGKVVLATRNSQVEEERLWRYADMRALFRFIEDYMEQDHQPGKPRTYVTARFDLNDGRLLHYTRSVMSQRERQEITVSKFEAVNDVREKDTEAGDAKRSKTEAKEGP